MFTVPLKTLVKLPITKNCELRALPKNKLPVPNSIEIVANIPSISVSGKLFQTGEQSKIVDPWIRDPE